MNRPQLEQLIRDSLTQSPETHVHMLAARIRELEAQVAHAIPADRVLGDVVLVVDREEWAELRGIESCGHAVMAYDGLVGTEERNRLKRLDALRANQGGAAT